MTKAPGRALCAFRIKKEGQHTPTRTQTMRQMVNKSKQTISFAFSKKYAVCCVCVISQVKEHGDERGVARIVPPSLPEPPRGGSEGGVAEEAAQHHEELAAALVRAALGPALLLQRRGRNQTAGNISATFTHNGKQSEGGEIKSWSTALWPA